MSSVCPNGHTSTADDYCDVCGAPIDPAQQGAPAPSGPATGTIAAGAATGSPGAVAGGTPGANPCPHCGTENVAEALFCEACGYDFTTGTLPRSDAPEAATDAQSGPSPDPWSGASPDPSSGASPGPSSDTAIGSAADPAKVTTVDGAAVESSSESPTPDADFAFVAEVWIDPAWYQAQQSPDPLPSPGLPEVVPLRKSSVLVGRVSRSRNIHPEIDCEPDSGASRRQCQLTTDGTRWWVEDLDSANGTFVAGASDPLPGSPIAVGLKQEIQPGDRIYVGAWTRIVVRAATPEEQEGLI